MSFEQKRLELFKELTQIYAASGSEVLMSRALKKYYEPLCDEILYDNLGSIVAHKKSKKSNAPKVLVLAHMDEVSLHVGDIQKDGTIKINNIPNGIWEQTLMTQRVVVQTRGGKLVDGVINSIPPHLLTSEQQNTPMKLSNMIVDIGARSKEEVMSAGIKLFDPIFVKGELIELLNGQRLLSKAFDNRYGCILGIEMLQELKNIDLDIDLYVGASVQEEAGLRGAETVAHLIKPDMAIILDCSTAADVGNCQDAFGRLGDGVLIRVADRSMIAFPMLVDYQVEMCEKTGAKYQYFTTLGGTDAGIVHKSLDGVLTLTNCICARNIHTSGSIMDTSDYEAAHKVLLGMLKDLSKERIDGFKLKQR